MSRTIEGYVFKQSTPVCETRQRRGSGSAHFNWPRVSEKGRSPGSVRQRLYLWMKTHQQWCPWGAAQSELPASKLDEEGHVTNFARRSVEGGSHNPLQRSPRGLWSGGTKKSWLSRKYRKYPKCHQEIHSKASVSRIKTLGPTCEEIDWCQSVPRRCDDDSKHGDDCVRRATYYGGSVNVQTRMRLKCTRLKTFLL